MGCPEGFMVLDLSSDGQCGRISTLWLEGSESKDKDTDADSADLWDNRPSEILNRLIGS